MFTDWLHRNVYFKALTMKISILSAGCTSDPYWYILPQNFPSLGDPCSLQGLRLSPAQLAFLIIVKWPDEEIWQGDRRGWGDMVGVVGVVDGCGVCHCGVGVTIQGFNLKDEMNLIIPFLSSFMPFTYLQCFKNTIAFIKNGEYLHTLWQ